MDKEVKIINLTPHIVTICREDGTLIQEFESQGLTRLTQKTIIIGEVNGIPITKTEFGEVEGLPKQKEGIMYIVSRLILTACTDRSDLLVPNELVRDDKGNIIGCKSLAIN